jgi:hypothetical protein
MGAMCNILESAAPNVSELQLFRDDTEECIGCECPFIFTRRFIFVPPSFIFFLSPIHSSPPGPLDRRCCVFAVLPVTISDLD